MSEDLKKFLKKNILDIYNDKSILNLKIYMDIYTKVYRHCIKKTSIYV